MNETIEHPLHYNSLGAHCPGCERPIECMDVLIAIDSFHLGNVIKYIWRHEHKSGIEDLKKAKYYLDDYIKRNEV